MDQLNRALKTIGGPTAMAKALGIGQSTVSNWKMRGNVPVEYLAAIEQATGGTVTRKHFRPKDWKRIWPELS